MRHGPAHVLRLGFLAAAALLLTALPSALAQHACCFPGGDCAPVADVVECNGLGGIFLAGGDCALDACGPGACCDGPSCGVLDAWSCIASGRTYAGAGTTCLEDPCASGVGACCLPDGGCVDASPENCDAMGGAWLGAGTTCAGGGCDSGACCTPGSCAPDVRYLCEAGGGVFVPGGDCAGDGCDLANACPADSIFAQERQTPLGFTAWVSEEGAGLVRWDQYGGAAGTIESIRWWGFELAYDQETTQFSACEETDPSFRIELAPSIGGAPGPVACSYTLAVPPTPTGILYGEIELLEYSVVLPSPCILPSGWVSIVGLGDPDCWFVWMGSNDGDGTSVCEGCQSFEQLADLSVCIGGTLGGVFGACCDLSTAECVDDVPIADCATNDRRFEPGTACVDLDPPCFFATGACCLEVGGLCEITLPADCVAMGGEWLGVDTDCIQCPVLGTCCFPDGSCFLLEQDDCLNENGTYTGPGASCEDCPQPPVCPEGTLLGQDADTPADFLGATSEAAAGFRRYEDFDGVAGAIEAITWWGFDLDNIEGTNAFVECDEPDPTFEISFHEDAGGVPGPAVCTYTLLATRTPLQLTYLGAELNAYHVELPVPCVLVRGWVSIVGLGDEECWFLWVSAGQGSSWCDGCGAAQEGVDLAVCLRGAIGGVLGACCDASGGSCADSVDIADCTEEGLRFTPGTACDELDPPCGVLVGACCFETAACSIETEDACGTLGGSWLGGSTSCAQCPCLTPCPAGSVAEGEPVCFDEYVDEFNGGCDAKSQLFAPITIGTTVCGESGVYAVGVELTGDFDWFAVEVPRAMELRWSVESELTVAFGIVDPAGGCPGTVLAAAGVTPCEPGTVAAEVEPGTYWLAVQPLGAGDEAGCGTRYVATLSTPCPTDVNGDLATDVDDLVAVILAWGSADAAADVNFDGTVDVDDLLAVILAWGPCGDEPSAIGHQPSGARFGAIADERTGSAQPPAPPSR